MTEDFAILFNAEEAARYVGVTTERILCWARDGHLPAAAQTERGDLLFRRYVLDRAGETLVPLAPVRRPKKRGFIEHEPSRIALPCGCVLFGGEDWPTIACRDFMALELAARLTEALAAAIPDDPFFGRLSHASQDALVSHLVPARGEQPATEGEAIEARHRALAAKPVETCTT